MFRNTDGSVVVGTCTQSGVCRDKPINNSTTDGGVTEQRNVVTLG